MSSGANTEFRKRGDTSNSGCKISGGLGGAVIPPSGVWGQVSEAFAIWVFTSTRKANTYVIIPSDFAF